MKSVCILLGLIGLISPLMGEEGMWPLNQLPVEKIQEKYGVNLDHQWIERAQKSALRVSTGGSGSLVSRNGLVLTNHHVGFKAIADLSSEGQDFIKEGFYANDFNEELKCPKLHMDQLTAIRDVTYIITAGIDDSLPAAEKERLRKSAIATLKQEAAEETGLHPEVISLYQNTRFHLYLYKRYTDIRLVMAPELEVASFGGDIENFEFPRHCLDIAFFRVYDEGKPLNTEYHFSWSPSGPKEGEGLFVVGNPGSTSRLFTSDHLRFYRDHTYPLVINYINEQIAQHERFAQLGEEEARIAQAREKSLRNSLKVYNALDKGLKGDTIIPAKASAEASYLAGCVESEKAPWAELRRVFDGVHLDYARYFFLEGTGGQYSKLYSWAKHLLRLSEERGKENSERLPEYADSELAILEKGVLSKEPIYPKYEKDLLAHGLLMAQGALGKYHPAMEAALKGNSITDAVDQMMAETQMGDREYRVDLWNHPEKVANSSDPLIVLAKSLDPFARSSRKQVEDGMLAARNEAYAKIVPAMLKQRAGEIYPDATFTLRLSYGALQGYQDEGAYIHPITNMGELYEKALKYEEKAPFSLPKRWKTSEEFVDKATPMNFATTHDTIGGNSGSPLINAKHEIVGVLFDGNRQSLTKNFAYAGEQGRSINVHSEAIIHSLKQVYGADRLVIELWSGSAPPTFLAEE